MTSAAELTLKLRGGNAEFWDARDPEILVEGPRGTGKTRTILQLFDALCRHIPGLRLAIVRKYQRTLATTCLVTFNEQVLPAAGGGVAFFGGNESEPASYRYSNGSRIVTGGMDNPEKVKSSEYDAIYCNEITELTEEDLESLLPLLRHMINGKPGLEHQRLIGDCNPANAGHWVKQRCERGQMRDIKTVLKDNPAFYDDEGQPTEAGVAYISTLTGLTGSRFDRWVLGLWTGVENQCYAMFDREVHVRPLEPGLAFKETIIWVDYGSVHRCSVGALSIDQFNRRWVRECWGQPDVDRGVTLNRIVGQFKERYTVNGKRPRGRVDPNQRYLAGQYGFSVATGGSGGVTGPPRLHRVDLLEPLFYTWPGGRVTPPGADRLNQPTGPFMEPDSPGFFIVEGMPGNDELADQIEGYHYIYMETERGKSKDIYRVDEDHVAGVEYANEEFEEGTRLELPRNPTKITERPPTRVSF